MALDRIDTFFFLKRLIWGLYRQCNITDFSKSKTSVSFPIILFLLEVCFLEFVRKFVSLMILTLSRAGEGGGGGFCPRRP